VGEEKERAPEDGGADGEVVFEMAGGGSKGGLGLAVFVEARAAKTFVGMLIVPGEVQVVLDERSAGKSVIANAIAAHPGIESGSEQRKRRRSRRSELCERRRGAGLASC